MKVDIWQETKYKTNATLDGVAILIQRLQPLDENRFIVKPRRIAMYFVLLFTGRSSA
jgi:hypothetical protein